MASTAIILASALARTASGYGTSVDRAEKSAAQLTLSVSAASGTSPSLAAAVETSQDGTAWTTAAAFATRATTGQETVIVAGLSQYVRVAWTVSSGAEFTFAVAGELLTCYAEPADIYAFSVPESAILRLGTQKIAKALLAATEEADGRFNNRYVLPLVAWGQDLSKHVGMLAGADLIVGRGLNPDVTDKEIIDGVRDRAVAWLTAVGSSKISPPGMVDSTPEIDEAAPILYTHVRRGW
jgi:phage gp36-like protein